ncbi:hypothetical protein R3P38DRAFT_2772495 [Favolaschia claudopus]|uniref:Uncharacterized protein n=1 Tax=Favolaschia claudopus TaxID=2862362 RepID=A0AAW0C6A0_9AGAR
MSRLNRMKIPIQTEIQTQRLVIESVKRLRRPKERSREIKSLQKRLKELDSESKPVKVNQAKRAVINGIEEHMRTGKALKKSKESNPRPHKVKKGPFPGRFPAGGLLEQTIRRATGHDSSPSSSSSSDNSSSTDSTSESK